MRVATADELERAVKAHGPVGARAALRRYGLLAPITGAAGLAIPTGANGPQAIVTANTAGTATTITSSSFSPPANSLLVIGIGSTASATGATVSSISDSLTSHLGYSNRVSVVENINHADAEIWTAPVGPTAPGSMTVTATFGVAPSYNAYIAVLIFTGAAATQNGATATATATSASPAAPSGSLTTTQSGSWVVGFVTNYTNATAPTIPSGQTDSFNSNAQFAAGAGGDSAWMQATSSPTPAGGTLVTINDTAPSVEYAMAVAEILASGSGPTANPQIAAGFFAA